MNHPIDIVIPWVSGEDPAWREQYRASVSDRYPSGNTGSIRFENWGNLHLLFRAIETFMPWFHKIFLVTCGEVPAFLDPQHPKLRIVSHREYIPAEYLPTFNSNTIEMNLHRIEDLGDNFILFNDDLFPLRYIPETYYFQDDVPCDEVFESVIVPVDGIGRLYGNALTANDVRIVNRNFEKLAVVSQHHDKWFSKVYGKEALERNRTLSYWHHFTGFKNPHMANAYQKHHLQELWEKEHDLLDIASRNQFRYYTDISHIALRYWQLCKGDFVPRKALGEKFSITMENYQDAAHLIETQATQMISISEVCTPEEFVMIRERINRALQSILPDASSFER